MTGGGNTPPPPPPPPPKLDSSSPFYISPHDKPRDLITSARLNLKNYEARRKFCFVDGTYNAPVAPCTTADWKVLQNMVLSWLLNTIEQEVQRILPRTKSPRELWDVLKRRFSQTDGPKVQRLKAELGNCKQAEGMTVATYFAKLSQLWGDIDIHEPIISCSGGECSAAKAYAERRESDRVYQFLLGLLPKFSSLRTKLNMMRRTRGFKMARKVIHVFRRVTSYTKNGFKYEKLNGSKVLSNKPISKLFQWVAKIKHELLNPGSTRKYTRVAHKFDLDRKVARVPKGHLAVYVEEPEGDTWRVLVPVLFLNHPLFGKLLKEAENVYGYDHSGRIMIPCPLSEFEFVKSRIAATRVSSLNCLSI